jgi:hypothetical protein
MTKAPKKRRPPNADRKLRELIAISYADPEADMEIHLANLEKVVEWVRSGRRVGKPNLQVVDSKAGGHGNQP